jgi:DNA-binding LacI/PurR family transcriptional regulator
MPTIYNVARVAGVATSTVSRALSKPGRVSFKTAEHIRKVTKELGDRSQNFERDIQGSVADQVAAVLLAARLIIRDTTGRHGG